MRISVCDIGLREERLTDFSMIALRGFIDKKTYKQTIYINNDVYWGS